MPAKHMFIHLSAPKKKPHRQDKHAHAISQEKIAVDDEDESLAKWRKIAVGLPPEWTTVERGEHHTPKEIVCCGNYLHSEPRDGAEMLVVKGMMGDRVPFLKAPVYAGTK